jgi:hypothetical protein
MERLIFLKEEIPRSERAPEAIPSDDAALCWELINKDRSSHLVEAPFIGSEHVHVGRENRTGYGYLVWKDCLTNPKDIVVEPDCEGLLKNVGVREGQHEFVLP